VVLFHRRQALDGVGRQRTVGVDELMMLIAQQYGVLVRVALLEGEWRLPARPVRALADDVGDLAQHDHRVVGAALRSQQPLAVRERTHVA
jgi:hypothetical protein